MKNIFQSLLAAGLLLGVAVAALAGPDVPPKPGPYFFADMGGTINQDTAVKEFLGPPTAPTTVKFNPGFRLGVGVGLPMSDMFSVEFESGVMADGISSITPDGSANNATLANVPFLVNARFQLPNKSRFVPYVGAGAGGSVATLSVDRLSQSGAEVTGSASTIVFAYQAFAGVRYNINKQIDVGLAYHYFGTSDPEWSAQGGGNVKFGAIQTHAISASVEFRF